jgi:molecular chaperone DnaK
MEPIVGIDLGTCNSCIAAVVDKQVRAMSDDDRTTVPSVFAMSDGREIVGFAAKMQIISNPYQTITGIKRILGRAYDSSEVQRVKRESSYEIVCGSDGRVRVRAEHLMLTPVEVCGHILSHLRKIAEQDLGEPVRRAVISVPAHFGDAQRNATKEAAELAKLEVIRLLNEPTASALAYSLRDWGKRRIAVFDLGGGTFDFTLMNVEDRFFEALATGGDSYLGGTDFDYEIVRWLVQRFKEKEGVNLATDRTALLRLKLAAERAKIELSDAHETPIDLPAIATATCGGTHLSETLLRDQLEQMCRKYVDRCVEICERTLSAAQTTVHQIDEVILVGGQSRMPLVARAVRDFFGKEPRADVLGDEVVAIGAAAQGYALGSAVPPLPSRDTSTRPRAAAPPPSKATRPPTGQPEVQADEAVLLLDVLPMTVGLEGPDDTFVPLLLRNETLPTETRHVVNVSPCEDGKLRFRVLQGESRRASENVPVGELVLEGVPIDTEGRAKVEIRFRVDANGLLQVRAWDRPSGARSFVTLESPLGGTSVRASGGG